MKQISTIKPDVEGEYVANIVARERTMPRSLPNGSLLRLYTLSPNSRYSIFVALLILAASIFSIFLTQVSHQHYPGDTIVLIVGGLLVLVALALPLAHARRMKYAIEYGITAVGRVDSVESARDTPYSTAEGMRNGAIRAEISYTYTVNGKPASSRVFLDRPWVRLAKPGTQLKLLVDPAKPSVLYVIGIATQRRN